MRPETILQGRSRLRGPTEEGQRAGPLEFDLRVVGELVAEVIQVGDGFLTALPSLRLAFMYFTAREKVNLADGLFGAAADSATDPVPLAVSTAQAADAMAFEIRLLNTAVTYGIELPAAKEPTP